MSPHYMKPMHAIVYNHVLAFFAYYRKDRNANRPIRAARDQPEQGRKGVNVSDWLLRSGQPQSTLLFVRSDEAAHFSWMLTAMVNLTEQFEATFGSAERSIFSRILMHSSRHCLAFNAAQEHHIQFDQRIGIQMGRLLNEHMSAQGKDSFASFSRHAKKSLTANGM